MVALAWAKCSSHRFAPSAGVRLAGKLLPGLFGPLFEVFTRLDDDSCVSVVDPDVVYLPDSLPDALINDSLQRCFLHRFLKCGENQHLPFRPEDRLPSTRSWRAAQATPFIPLRHSRGSSILLTCPVKIAHPSPGTHNHKYIRIEAGIEAQMGRSFLLNMADHGFSKALPNERIPATWSESGRLRPYQMTNRAAIATPSLRSVSRPAPWLMEPGAALRHPPGHGF